MQDNGVDKVDAVVGMNNQEGALVLMSVGLMGAPLEGMFLADTFRMFMDACLFMRGLHGNQVIRKVNYI